MLIPRSGWFIFHLNFFTYHSGNSVLNQPDQGRPYLTQCLASIGSQRCTISSDIYISATSRSRCPRCSYLEIDLASSANQCDANTQRKFYTRFSWKPRLRSANLARESRFSCSYYSWKPWRYSEVNHALIKLSKKVQASSSWLLLLDCFHLVWEFRVRRWLHL